VDFERIIYLLKLKVVFKLNSLCLCNTNFSSFVGTIGVPVLMSPVLQNAPDPEANTGPGFDACSN
jgi:hypothetical protein